jgi:hypothetical protein
MRPRTDVRQHRSARARTRRPSNRAAAASGRGPVFNAYEALDPTSIRRAARAWCTVHSVRSHLRLARSSGWSRTQPHPSALETQTRAESHRPRRPQSSTTGELPPIPRGRCPIAEASYYGGDNPSSRSLAARGARGSLHRLTRFGHAVASRARCSKRVSFNPSAAAISLRLRPARRRKCHLRRALGDTSHQLERFAESPTVQTV